MDVQSTNRMPRNREESGSFSFVQLAILLFLLFFRPADLFTSLKILHLPMLFALLCMMTHFATSVSRGESIFRFTPITKMMCIISLWALLGMPFAFWKSGVLGVFVNDWLKMLALFLLLANIPRNVKQIRIVVWICVLSATAVCSMAIGNYILNGALVAGRLTALVNGPYSGSNYLSVTIVLMLPFVLFDFFLHPRIVVRVFALGCAGILMLANLLTESRAGILGMALVVLSVFWKLRKWGKNLVPIVAGIVVGAPIALLMIPHGVWERFSTLVNDYDIQSLDNTSTLRMAAGSQKERLQLILKALSLTGENPVFGVGMGNFSTASAHEWSTGTGRDWVQSHNTYLQFSSELGLPGLLLYVILLSWTFKTLRRAREQIPDGTADMDDHLLRLLCDATAVSLIGYAVVSGFANVGYQPYYFVAAGIAQALAFVVLCRQTRESDSPAQRIASWVEAEPARTV